MATTCHKPLVGKGWFDCRGVDRGAFLIGFLGGSWPPDFSEISVGLTHAPILYAMQAANSRPNFVPGKFFISIRPARDWPIAGPKVGGGPREA
jgi:hypothetical protein